uniref:Uncharacterized protein n=1 Tax=Globodera rostochiensis TaxID=31243 RepID=A0A914H6N2_GLORO
MHMQFIVALLVVLALFGLPSPTSSSSSNSNGNENALKEALKGTGYTTEQERKIQEMLKAPKYNVKVEDAKKIKPKKGGSS